MASLSITSSTNFAGWNEPCKTKFQGNLNKGILELNNCNLDGPLTLQAIQELPDLHTIKLVGNKLNGPLPSSLFEKTDLEYLKLSDNKLTGNIPEGLSKLNKLKWLELQNNEFTGTLPSFILDVNVNWAPDMEYLFVCMNNDVCIKQNDKDNLSAKRSSWKNLKVHGDDLDDCQVCASPSTTSSGSSLSGISGSSSTSNSNPSSASGSNSNSPSGFFGTAASKLASVAKRIGNMLPKSISNAFSGLLSMFGWP